MESKPLTWRASAFYSSIFTPEVISGGALTYLCIISLGNDTNYHSGECFYNEIVIQCSFGVIFPILSLFVEGRPLPQGEQWGLLL